MNDPHASEAGAATSLYALSPYRVSPDLLRSVAIVKEAAAHCNAELGLLRPGIAEAISRHAGELRSLSDSQLLVEFPLDAYQGGAGTSTNMAVNEWIAERASDGGVVVDPHDHVNLNQSTNDVMPTALRLMMHDRLTALESVCESLQAALQQGEQEYDAILKPARTQLREALVTTLGREFGTWAHAVARDRWRCFKARERIREVNLGGTAIGSGAGAPRGYVLSVVRSLQRLVDHPISRAEHLTEATSNYDTVVEAMQAPKLLALDLRRIASDIRLLASGPHSGIGELVIPRLIRGSSIMAGKVNPVIPEAVIQCAERIVANDALLTRLASMSELELNAFFPAIAHTVHESLYLAERAASSLADYLSQLLPDSSRCARGLRSSHADAVALLPLLGYSDCEVLMRRASRDGMSLRELLAANGLFTGEEGEVLFSSENLTSLGYDQELYEIARAKNEQPLKRLVAEVAREEAESSP